MHLSWGTLPATFQKLIFLFIVILPMACGGIGTTLTPDTPLLLGQSMQSPNGRYQFSFQVDGNLVLRDQDQDKTLWASGTNGKDGVRLVLQNDNNLVLYTGDGDSRWSSKTVDSGADRLVLDDNGQLALMDGNKVVWSVGNTDGGDNGGGDNGTGSGADGVKIAFIGDTGSGSNFQRVLDLIKSEKADLLIVMGDTAYGKTDERWDQRVRDTLGDGAVGLIASGNHDTGDSDYNLMLSLGKQRLNRNSDVKCSGTYGEKMTCRYRGVYIVLSSVGTRGSGHASFIDNSLSNAPDGMWRVCAWHKNQRDMQAGGKSDEVGWDAYENCRRHGAIIATGHEHSYSRTHLLSDMSDQDIASKSSEFTVSEGKTFAFVSGLGGVGIRDQERGGDWWAKIYTSTQGATYGSMFGVFDGDTAEFYFKTISGKVIDRFTVKKGY